MKLSSITIKNYMALDEITLALNPCMNVLYGTNGAGKSSILYALHDFLGLLFSQEIVSPDFRLFPGRTVRDHNKDTEIGLCFSNGCTVSATLQPVVAYREPVTVAYGWRQSCQLADGTRISHSPDFNVQTYSFFPGKTQDNIDPELPTLYHSIDFLTVILQHLPYNIYRLLIFFLILGSDSCFLRANF